MYDLGQSARLQTRPVDGDGNPSTPAGLALSIRQPDGTSTSVGGPFTAAPFVVSFTPTQPGRHAVRWLSSDGWADTDTFDVWPADPRFIFNLAEARRALRETRDSRRSDDDDLRLFMAATTPVIEDIVGPVVPELRTFVRDGGGCAITIPGPVLPGSVSVAGGSSVTVNEAAGVVYGSFPSGRQNVVITARVGMAVIPPNVKLAAREEFRFLWQQSQQASHPSRSDETEAEYTPSGFAVPRRVIELCGPYKRLGAIG